MRKEIKELWLKALRSGEYVQGKNVLRTENNTYCCLGVLCDIHRKRNKKGGWHIRHGGDLIDYKTGGQYSPYSLTAPLMRWAGLQGREYEVGQLANRNDSGESFEAIADYIEKDL